MFSQLDSRRDGLRARYAEPHRAYHNQSHIDAMLAGLHAQGDAVSDPATVELAVWYHDAIYDPAAFDNEARSADLMRAEMSGLTDPARIETADRMIRLTANYALPPDGPDGVLFDTALFLDLDLAILGSAPGEYDRYEKDIADEYRPVYGAILYRAGRAKFLQSLLGQPRLFRTDRFHDALDARARANIGRALGPI